MLDIIKIYNPKPLKNFKMGFIIPLKTSKNLKDLGGPNLHLKTSESTEKIDPIKIGYFVYN